MGWFNGRQKPKVFGGPFHTKNFYLKTTAASARPCRENFEIYGLWKQSPFIGFTKSVQIYEIKIDQKFDNLVKRHQFFEKLF